MSIAPIQISVPTEFHPVRLFVSAESRYWEDGEINGDADDEEGTRIPCKEGNLWKPVIDLVTGQIINWPIGTYARIHYKVCDQGEYWLEDDTGKRLKWKSDYVPDSLLCVGDEPGYGDYIKLFITADGKIDGWKVPSLKGDDWLPA